MDFPPKPKQHMNLTYHINQVAESQPDADDSTVPISIARRAFFRISKRQPASWKLGMRTVNKQGDQYHLYTNLCREASWRASHIVGLAQHGTTETTKRCAERVWKVACYTPAAGLARGVIPGANSSSLLSTTTRVRRDTSPRR